MVYDFKISSGYRYIRLLSNVLEWQKTQDRGNDMRIKCESSNTSHQNNSSDNYQTKSIVTFFKKEKLHFEGHSVGLRTIYSGQRNPISSHLICDKNGNNLLMIAPNHPKQLINNTGTNNFNNGSQLMRSTLPRQSSNVSRLSPLTTQQCNNLSLSTNNGMGPHKRPKIERDEEESVNQSRHDTGLSSNHHISRKKIKTNSCVKDSTLRAHCSDRK